MDFWEKIKPKTGYDWFKFSLDLLCLAIFIVSLAFNLLAYKLGYAVGFQNGQVRYWQTVNPGDEKVETLTLSKTDIDCLIDTVKDRTDFCRSNLYSRMIVSMNRTV